MLGLLLLLETEEDRISFQDIYEKIHLKLLYTARAILPDTQDAEEIVHDVFTKIADDFPAYRNKSMDEMIGLGIVMTRNACINRIRYRKRHSEVSFEMNEKFIGEGDVLEDVVREETKEELGAVFRKLKEKDRDILTLRYYYNLSYKEIAKILGIREKAVDMRLYRAKNRLRKDMKDKND